MEPWTGDWCVMLWIRTINHRKRCLMYFTLANKGYSYAHKGDKLNRIFTFPQEVTHKLLSDILWHDVYSVTAMFYPLDALNQKMEAD